MVYFRSPFFHYSKKLNLVGKPLRNGSKGMTKVDGDGNYWVLDALFFLFVESEGIFGKQ